MLKYYQEIKLRFYREYYLSQNKITKLLLRDKEIRQRLKQFQGDIIEPIIKVKQILKHLGKKQLYNIIRTKELLKARKEVLKDTTKQIYNHLLSYIKRLY